MFRMIFIIAIRTRTLLRAWLPSNILLDLIRTRRGLKWGVPAMLIAVPYLAAAYWCTVVIAGGGPGWLHLVFLVCIWSAFKFIAMGPVSVLSLLAARGREHRQRVRADRPGALHPELAPVK
ncbi:sulfate permease [Microbacterium lacticum]